MRIKILAAALLMASAITHHHAHASSPPGEVVSITHQDAPATVHAFHLDMPAVAFEATTQYRLRAEVTDVACVTILTQGGAPTTPPRTYAPEPSTATVWPRSAGQRAVAWLRIATA